MKVDGRWPLEEVHLRLVARRMLHDGGYCVEMAPNFANETLYRAVAVAEVVVFLEVLPDALGA